MVRTSISAHIWSITVPASHGRLLRAVRFEQRFDFNIEPRTLALLEESLPLLKKLTGARIRHEINLILAEPKAPAMLARLNELGIMEAIHPALPWDHTLKQHLADLDIERIDPVWNLPAYANGLDLRQTLSYLVWLGRLPEMTLRSIVSRLRCKSELKRLLIATSRLNHALPDLRDAPPSVIVSEVEKAPRLAIYAAFFVNPENVLREALRHYVSEWASVAPHTSGDDLRTMGLKPSPAYGRILKTLRDAWLDGNLHSVEEEKAMLHRLVADAKEIPPG